MWTQRGSVTAHNITVVAGRSYRSVDFPSGSGTNVVSEFLPGQSLYRLSEEASKRELKSNIEDIPSGLDIIENLKPRIFNWKKGEIDPSTNEPWTDVAKQLNELDKDYGFIVEEVFEVDKQLVNKKPPKDMSLLYDVDAWIPSMWKQNAVIALLTKAVQELSEKVKDLESRLES
jgi:hypothetical protein